MPYINPLSTQLYIKLFDISIILHPFRTLFYNPLNFFKVYNAILLTIFTLLSQGSLKLILTNENLFSLTNISQISI